MDGVIEICHYKTELEEKYEHTDRFKFTQEELDRFYETRDQRVKERMERRLKADKEVQEQFDKMEEDRLALKK